MKTLALLARKGGTGKTTLAVHMAVAAVQAGHRVLLVDTDPQSSAADWWRVRAGETPELVECEAARVPDVLRAARKDGISLTVIDTRPSVEADTAALARLADLVLTPTRPAILDLRAIGATVDVVRASRARAAIVINGAPPSRGGLEAALTTEARQALESYRVPVAPVAIGLRAALSHALVDGRAVTEFEPDSKAAAELLGLYRYTEEALWRSAPL